MQVQPYLFFDGRCEEAIEFYKKALGAKVEMLMRFKETSIMASDGQCLGKPSFQGFALSLTAADDAEADRLFAAVSNGGQVQMPLAKTFFSSRFGMAADRFGVSWMVVVMPQ
jgi:PhnB protein